MNSELFKWNLALDIKIQLFNVVVLETYVYAFWIIV